MRKRRGRPCLKRRVSIKPKIRYFKPQGIPAATLDILDLSYEELEALRLKNIQELDQKECAEKMKTSVSTFQRILYSASKKVTLALVEGKAIKLCKEKKYEN